MSETPKPVVELESRAVESAAPSTEPAQVAPWAKEVVAEAATESQTTKVDPIPETAVAAREGSKSEVKKQTGDTSRSDDWTTAVNGFTEQLTS